MYTYFVFVVLLLVTPVVSFAAIPAVYTNENFWTSEHDKPVSINLDGNGGFYGYTQTGKYYSQVPIEAPEGIRIQKFQIDEAFYYISDRGVFRADDDKTAVEIYRTDM